MSRLSIFLFLTLCLPVSASELVIVLSWDGMRHDFPDLADFPGLQTIEAEGVRSRLIPSYPADTFPGHVTMATGALPEVHGIISNTMYDRQRGRFAYSNDASWINAEPVWVAVERQGLASAVYFWVGSETDWQGIGASYRITPFDNDRPEQMKVDQMLAWIDLPKADRPSLIMSYFRGADSIAHLKGWQHPDVLTSLQTQDAQLKRLIDGIEQRSLWRTTTLMVVADHGMTDATSSVSISTPLLEAGVAATIVGGSTVKQIFLDQPKQELEKALSALRSINHIEIFTGDDIPERIRFPNRTGDIVVTTTAPYVLDGEEDWGSRISRVLRPISGWKPSGHGYDPGHPDMAAIFLAMGANVNAEKQIESVHQTQIAPTITDLLNIGPPLHASGTPLALD